MTSTTGRTPATDPAWPGIRHVTLTPAEPGTWQVSTGSAPVGTWQRTEEGARLSDLAGEVMAVVTAFRGTSVAAVAGLGAHGQQWSDLAHKILAGLCDIRA
jgi:hypothetical protein